MAIDFEYPSCCYQTQSYFGNDANGALHYNSEDEFSQLTTSSESHMKLEFQSKKLKESQQTLSYQFNMSAPFINAE